MASESHSFDDVTEFRSSASASEESGNKPAGADWFSFQDQTDLEELKRKVEMLKAQAGAPRQKPATTPAPAFKPAPEPVVRQQPAFSSLVDDVTLDAPVAPTPARPKFQMPALPSLDQTPGDDIRPLFSAKPVETAPPKAATPTPLETFRPAAPPVMPAARPVAPAAPAPVAARPIPPAPVSAPTPMPAMPTVPRMTASQDPAPPSLLKPAAPVNRPTIAAPGSTTNPPHDRQPMPRRTSAESPTTAAAPQVSAEELRGSFRKHTPSKRSGVSYSLFTMTFMYAVTVSTVCGYLAFERFTGRPDVLESLPDVPVPSINGQAGYRLVPEKATMPAGHQLSLGEGRRFGHVKITPIKVEQLSSDAGSKASQLALWVRVENLSADQTFAPLDERLMTTKVADPVQPGVLRSNSFLGMSNTETGFQQAALMLKANDPSLAKQDQLFGYFPEVAPGEWYETAIVCESVELAEATQDQFHWRLQLRKGIAAESGQAVTTVVEVNFNPSDVQHPAMPIASR
ncbi:hypothetical protein [Lacunimicrobium album]